MFNFRVPVCVVFKNEHGKCNSVNDNNDYTEQDRKLEI